MRGEEHDEATNDKDNQNEYTNNNGPYIYYRPMLNNGYRPPSLRYRGIADVVCVVFSLYLVEHGTLASHHLAIYGIIQRIRCGLHDFLKVFFEYKFFLGMRNILTIPT